MKYLLIPLIAVTFIIPSVSYAQDASSSEEVAATSTVRAPKLLPGNPFYFLKTLTERAELALTFNKEKRAEREAAFTEERKAELTALMAEGKTDLAEKMKVRIAAQEAKLKEHLDALREKNPEAAAKIEAQIEKRRDRFEQRMEQGTSTPKDRLEHRTEMLKERLQDAPEAARPGLERALMAPRMERSGTTTKQFRVAPKPQE